MKYIAIDIGSSFIKSALLDIETCGILRQNKISSLQRLRNPDKNCFEISASQLVDMVKKLIDGYTKQYDHVAGIIFSTQMHGFVYSIPGRPDTYISWQDMRCLNPMKDGGQSYMSHLQDLFSKEEMVDCGVYIKPSLGLCNLYALLNSDESIGRDGELFTLGSYIIAKLTGNNVCHMTNAAPLGLANVVTHDWDKSITRKAGFDDIIFPRIAKSDFEVCGTYLSNGQELAVYPDFGDQQTAILGCMAGNHDVVVNVATASQVSSTTEIFLSGNYETRPYFEGGYINTISNMPAGRNLDVMIRFIQNSVAQITAMQVKASDVWKAINDSYRFDTNGLKVNMGFYPMPQNLDGGSISGIKPGNFDLNSLFSAAFENMAQTYWKNIKLLCGGEENMERIICAGGVSWKTPRLLETIGRISGHKCVLSPVPDEALLGLFRIALVCAGVCKDLKDKTDLILNMEGRK